MLLKNAPAAARGVKSAALVMPLRSALPSASFAGTLAPMQHADPITESLELASERCEDLTPLVYARLFAAHPDMKPLFVRDKDDAVKGEMLARVITAILDFIGERLYAHTLIQSEVLTHNGYGVPPATFGVFFATVRDAVREVCAETWNAAMDAAWRNLLDALDAYVKQGVSDTAPA